MKTLDDTFSACGHRIAFYFDVEGCRISEENRKEFFEAAEERARAMIAEDYTSGELCWYDPQREREFTGWWNISK